MERQHYSMNILPHNQMKRIVAKLEKTFLHLISTGQSSVEEDLNFQVNMDKKSLKLSEK